MSDFADTLKDSFEDWQSSEALRAFQEAASGFDQGALSDGFARADKYASAADPRTGDILQFVSSVVNLETGDSKLSDDQVTGIFLNVITRRLQKRAEGDVQ